MWYDSVCTTVQEPTVTSTIVAKKTTTWGESGFPSEFLAVAERRRVNKFPHNIQRRAQRKLMILNNASSINDLRTPPGNLQHSIRINDRWRICFVWSEGNAYQVEIVDYH